MEKYARQAIAEGVKNQDDLVVTTDSEIYRVLNLHYNRNNQIEVRTKDNHTEMKMLSFWWNFYHWLYQNLSF